MSIRKRTVGWALSGVACVAALSLEGWAADWPQYRHDARRSGRTDEALPGSPVPHWRWRARHPPSPAWPGHDTRMPFDQAFHPVVAAGTVYVGSSADGMIYALDARTGRERWHACTSAPVRFAPVVADKRLFAASDDGFLYCLSTVDGRVLWKRRGGPNHELVMGNGFCVSRWPARGGPVVLGDTVFFGAGIWPAEGVYIYALDVATGAVRWLNRDSGTLRMSQPHGDVAESGISAQGYLAADSDRVYVPTGRAGPAALKRKDGTLNWFSMHAHSYHGGSDLVLAGDIYYVGGQAGYARTGGLRGAVRQDRVVQSTIPPYALNTLVPLDSGPVHYDKGEVRSLRWEFGEKPNRKGEMVKTWLTPTDWAVTPPYGGAAMVAASNVLVSAGPGRQEGTAGICLIDLTDKKVSWEASLDGTPYGLAIADSRLYVSTDRGELVCFGPENASPNGSAQASAAPAGAGLPAATVEVAGAAKQILARTGLRTGLCIDLGCGDGSLALELARTSELRIIAIDSDPAALGRARRVLTAAGLYGARVQVFKADPAASGLPDRVANVVVSGRSMTQPVPPLVLAEAGRVVRPWGGATAFGPGAQLAVTRRRALPDTGQWTHQYASAWNPGASTDSVARAPLRLAWYNDWGVLMPSRHGRAPAPLFKDGYLVALGLNAVLCADAYNGRLLWQYPIPDLMAFYNGEHNAGVARTHGVCCLADDSVYLRLQDDRCLRLDLATGEKLREYAVPLDDKGRTGTWGYIAAAPGALLGTVYHPRVKPPAVPRPAGLRFEAGELFALDPVSGKHLWTYRARQSIRHNAIAVADGKVFVVDCASRESQIAAQRRDAPSKAPPPSLVCLDLRTGQVLWSSDQDVFATVLAVSPAHDVLLLAGQMDLRGFQPQGDRLAAQRLAGVRPSDGKRLWDVTVPATDAHNTYLSRPLITGRTVYAQPWAFDLLTGERHQDFLLKGRGKHACGIVSGSPNLLLFRSGTLAYADLLNGHGETHSYGGIRPGCWINAIVAGGAVLMPDASEICSCSYLIKASVALQHGRTARLPPVVSSVPPPAGLQEAPPPQVSEDSRVLIPAGAVWRFRDAVAAPPDAWAQPDFDDGKWRSGQAQLGYGDGDEKTRLGFGSDAARKPMAVYFRHSFNWDDPAKLVGVTVHLLCDDGAVVYVNGREVVRDNMPAGPITHTSAAPKPIAGTGERTFDQTVLDPGQFRKGRNSVAVEVHQQRPASSDISFDLKLTARAVAETPAE
ncbi:MAG: PQQ-binding-like beta-propeller repeat protein [Lentisphaerae bacterium]|jgi:outer membrane protein assembly factor BamB|nr:PQQ-binding-like beta-propeller repeat protein [Lentisphaerota bacterium]MBT4816012.1 PQQ-binding-like beta-propeller repeat protein [Lentisphaerota bacterium]MBT5604535.1 PQQ-binding-like beta-propeller repeat protein [Lentisphaerota bacterium]MBT7061930.1 PQQ-binding-like beta-propeller repeat protein [Lentisphaerota bacterium]MBT7847930.1 PQQ-binding-like beta-propeller repeat protein [Lentisphaerota bacterium]